MPEWYFSQAPCRDVQLASPLDTCMRCGGELYGAEAEPDEWGHTYCPECQKWLMNGGKNGERTD